MIDYIIVGIILVAIVFAIKSTKKHKGGCSSCSNCPVSGKCSSENKVVNKEI